MLLSTIGVGVVVVVGTTTFGNGNGIGTCGIVVAIVGVNTVGVGVNAVGVAAAAPGAKVTERSPSEVRAKVTADVAGYVTGSMCHSSEKLHAANVLSCYSDSPCKEYWTIKALQMCKTIQ